MDDTYIQGMFSQRIGGNAFGQGNSLYKFETIKQAKREALLANPLVELIDLGVGEPDGMADGKVVAKLAEEAEKWENRGYADNGSYRFKMAAAAYMSRLYGVADLNLAENQYHTLISAQE